MPRKSLKDEKVQAELAALGQQDYVPSGTLEMDGPTQGITLKFDYTEIDDPATRAQARDAAMDINMRRHRAAQDIIMIGSKLLEMQRAIEHNFSKWIETEFEYSEGTANEYMNVARRFSHMPELVADVPPTVLRIMASPTLPDAGVQAILNAHDDALDLGTVLKAREADAIADQHRPEEAKRPRRERIARTIATNYSVRQGDDPLVKTLLENPGDAALATALQDANKEQLQKALSQLPPDDSSRRQVLEYALQAAQDIPAPNGTGFQAPAISTRRKDGVLVELPRPLWGKILEAFKTFDMNPTVSDKEALKIVKIIENSLETQITMTGQAKRDPGSYMLPTADFNHLIEIALIQAKEHIQKGNLKGYIPIAYLYFLEPSSGGKTSMIALMPDFDIKRRYELMEDFGERIAKEGHLCMAFLFVSEAWRSIYAGDELPKNHPMPRDDPKRIESITAIGQTVEGRLALGYLDVRRDRKDVMAPLEMILTPYDDDNPNDAKSDLCDAFWQGYRRALLENIKNSPGGKEMLDRLHKEASGSDPEAQGFKFN